MTGNASKIWWLVLIGVLAAAVGAWSFFNFSASRKESPGSPPEVPAPMPTPPKTSPPGTPLLPPPPPGTPSAQTKIPVYYSYAIPDKKKAGDDFTDNNDNPFLDAAIVNAKWAIANPHEGQYDWSRLDDIIRQWTGGDLSSQDTAKKIIIRVAPYTQTPLTKEKCREYDSDCQEFDNDGTPMWIYAKGVPRIKFECGGVCKAERLPDYVSIPRVWDNDTFLTHYGLFFMAIAERYGNDKRVLGFQPGFGHLGTMNAQPAKEGARELYYNQGWRLEKWAAYIKKVIDAAKATFPKKLFVRTPEKFLENVDGTSFKLKDHSDIAHDIFKHAAERGISITFSALTPNEERWKDTGIPELVEYIGSLPLAYDSFSVGFADDWPLYVPPKRSENCPGSTCGRDAQGFRRELQFALAAGKKMKNPHPLFLDFLRPEASAANSARKSCETVEEKFSDETCFRKEIRDIIKEALKE